MSLSNNYGGKNEDLVMFLEVLDQKLRYYPEEIVSAEFSKVVGGKQGKELWEFIQKHYPSRMGSQQIDIFTFIGEMMPGIRPFYGGPPSRSKCSRKEALRHQLSEILYQVEQLEVMSWVEHWKHVMKSYIHVSSDIAFLRLKIYHNGFPEVTIRWNYKGGDHYRRLTATCHETVKVDLVIEEEEVVETIDNFLRSYYRDPSVPQVTE